MDIWYRVRDLGAARTFYTGVLAFREVYVDEDDGWVRLERSGVEISLAEGEPSADGEDDPVAALVVDDVKAEAERLREAGVNVGVVLEISGAVRLLDVFDPDGNRLQLSEDI